MLIAAVLHYVRAVRHTDDHPPALGFIALRTSISLAEAGAALRKAVAATIPIVSFTASYSFVLLLVRVVLLLVATRSTGESPPLTPHVTSRQPDPGC
jgi:hypothetical protein